MSLARAINLRLDQCDAQWWSLDADSGLVVSTSAPGPGPADFGGWMVVLGGAPTPLVEES